MNLLPKSILAATVLGTMLGACYASTPFPGDEDAVSDHAADAADVADGIDTAADEGATDTASCPDGLTLCPSGCVDLLTDPANCGGCENVCPWGGTDPELNETGCLDPALATYQSCCAGSCVTPSDTACGACDLSCDATGHCSGMWYADRSTCEFACLSLGGATGDACAAPEDCTGIPGAGTTCVTNVGPLSFPGGYCTATDCAGPEDCGTGADCVNLMRTSFCLRTCVGDDECRTAEGYACATLPMGGSGTYCLPPRGF
jgi:hypothetical protein